MQATHGTGRNVQAQEQGTGNINFIPQSIHNQMSNTFNPQKMVCVIIANAPAATIMGILYVNILTSLGRIEFIEFFTSDYAIFSPVFFPFFYIGI